MAVQQHSTHETLQGAGPVAASGAITEQQAVFLPPPDAPAHAPAGSSWITGPAHAGPRAVAEQPRSVAALAEGDQSSAPNNRMLLAIVPPARLILATESPSQAAETQQQQSASPSWQRAVVSPFSAVAAQSARSLLQLVVRCVRESKTVAVTPHLLCVAAALRQAALLTDA